MNNQENISRPGKNFGALSLKLFLFILPPILLFSLYVDNDPFMVLRQYDNYDSPSVFMNEGAIAWKKYLLYRSKEHYDSFIIGNSCTMAYRGSEWKKYVHGNSFRLFGNSETIGDVYLKLSSLDKQKNQPIKNLLFIVDYDLLHKSLVRTDVMHIMPPDVSHVSKFRFQMTFLQGFFNPKFLVPYLDYTIFHTYRKYMKGVINPYGVIRSTYNNDALNPNERIIRSEGEKYWSGWDQKYGKTYAPEERRCIWKNQRKYLYGIKRICDKQHTHYKVVISPNFRKTRLNREDLKALQTIFGAQNVYDFSGVNALSTNKHNFYDLMHYRPIAGNVILRDIYAH